MKCARGKGNYGYDPTKVVRVALEYAVSVASVLLLNQATLSECIKTDVDPLTDRQLRG